MESSLTSSPVIASSEAALDSNKERAPPPPPTLIYFPQWDVQLNQKQEWSTKGVPDLFSTYSKVQKPADVKRSHLESLNLTTHQDVELDEFIPHLLDGSEYLPPTSWNRTDAKGAFVLDKKPAKLGHLSNGSKAPGQDQYIKLAKELVCENEDALRVIQRHKPRSGKPAPNLSHYRRFWVQLESMSMYWDTSLDRYFDVDASSLAQSTRPAIKTKKSGTNQHSQTPTSSGKPGKVQRYSGRRTGNGEKMPDHFRIDAIRQFLEPIAQAFGCQLSNPRRLPQLEVKSLLVPVTQTSLIWRLPHDKTEMKRGLLEGPVVGIQCRGETGFASSRHESIVDTARETAGLFLLAGERAREGKPKKIPGAGKWYTAKPRWGGGPGGPFGDAEGNKDPVGDVDPAAKKHIQNQHHHSSSTHRHRTEEEIWKDLSPGPGIWDSRVTYIAVGKDREDVCDQVFMVSSIFHHISYIKLQAHPAYIDFLTTGVKPDAAVLASKDFYPVIQRTKWYDLLVPADRLEALRAIWAILSYSMRPQELHPDIARPPPVRRKSEIGNTAFPFRKKGSSHIPAAEYRPPSERRSSGFF